MFTLLHVGLDHRHFSGAREWMSLESNLSGCVVWYRLLHPFYLYCN